MAMTPLDDFKDNTIKFAYRCSNCNALLYMATDRCVSNICAHCREPTLKRSPAYDRVLSKEGK